MLFETHVIDVLIQVAKVHSKIGLYIYAFLLNQQSFVEFRMSERNNSLMTVLCLPKSSIWSSNLALHVNCCVVLMVAARRHVIFKGRHKLLFATPRHWLEGESKWPACMSHRGMSHLSAKKCSWFPSLFLQQSARRLSAVSVICPGKGGTSINCNLYIQRHSHFGGRNSTSIASPSITNRPVATSRCGVWC